MRRLLLIGIGAGKREHVTIQAIEAMRGVDVFFSIDKGEEKADLAQARRDILDAYVKGRPYRLVSAPDPERDRQPSSYEATVKDWHERRAELFEKLIAEELAEDQCGAFLIWGDPSLYDSTLRIVRRILERGAVAFDYEVIPGITSVQALAAAHKIALNEIGGPVHITTGRALAAGLPDHSDTVVAMLDGQNAYKAIGEPGVDIYWGAYVGSADEILVSGDLAEVAGEIERRRAEARARKGWIMDVYLLRRRKGK